MELRRVAAPTAYDLWYPDTDFLTWADPRLWDEHFDLVIGNPPYSMTEAFLRAARPLLAHFGHLLFLLPTSFLASQRRGRGLFREWPPTSIVQLLTRPSFTGNGKTDNTEYGLLHWCGTHTRPLPPSFYWLDWKPPVIDARQARFLPEDPTLDEGSLTS